jgi:ABC-type lipoprotein release transport system permease subunit
MPVLVRLAVRNLVAHRAKSLIIGSLIALGVLVLVAGMSFMDSAAAGLRRSFVESFTGDVMISGKAGGPVSLFGVQSMGGTEATPVLPRSAEVMSYVSSRPEVKALTAQVTGAGQINVEGNDAANVDSLVFLFGIEPAGYRAMFDNIDLLAGRSLEPGEQGILISTDELAVLKRELKRDIKPGDTLIIQNFGTAIRSVTVRGIFAYRRSNAALGMICYIDAGSLRALEGILSEAPAWHFLIVSLKDPAAAAHFIADTNAWLKDNGIEAVASGWQRAAGPFATIPSLIRILLLAAILIVSVVAIIIIMNTLVASVIERTAEIGTMRALGARRGFIRRMFFIETLAIAVVAGFVGMGIGAGLVAVLHAIGVPASNMVVQLLAGGAVLRPLVSGSALAAALIVILTIGFIANLYPVSVALRISPMQAIRAGQAE